MSTFLIRSYQKSDHPDVLSLFRLNTPKFFDEEEETDLIRFLDSKLEFYFVVELHGTIVASGGINLQENKTIGVLSWDIVHPDFQRQGIGTELLKFRIQKLGEQNKKLCESRFTKLFLFYESAHRVFYLLLL